MTVLLDNSVLPALQGARLCLKGNSLAKRGLNNLLNCAKVVGELNTERVELSATLHNVKFIDEDGEENECSNVHFVVTVNSDLGELYWQVIVVDDDDYNKELAWSNYENLNVLIEFVESL